MWGDILFLWEHLTNKEDKELKVVDVEQQRAKSDEQMVESEAAVLRLWSCSLSFKVHSTVFIVSSGSSVYSVKCWWSSATSSSVFQRVKWDFFKTNELLGSKLAEKLSSWAD